jgi:hypothetical protein
MTLDAACTDDSVAYTLSDGSGDDAGDFHLCVSLVRETDEDWLVCLDKYFTANVVCVSA